VPSIDLRLRDVIEIASIVRRHERTGGSGSVIVQGTDTLEEVAFALQLLGPWRKPVIVTGAMRCADDVAPDGPANLRDAVRAAADRRLGDGSVAVVLNGNIFPATFVQKRHTAAVHAFDAPTGGAIGSLVESRVQLHGRARIPMPSLRPRASRLPRVALLRVALDDTISADAILAAEPDGLIVEGAGGGHVPSSLVESLTVFATRHPTVLASRIGAGATLRFTYGYAGSERNLLRNGLIPAGWLDGLKARVLLCLALAAGLDHAAIRSSFELYADLA
jgi:L-asparaginase